MDWITDALKGSVALEITGADPEGFLNRCAEQNLPFWDAVSRDAHTLRLRARVRDVRALCVLAERQGCQTEVLSEKGAPALWRGLRRRYALLLGIVFCLGGLVWSSLHVWEIRVRGNETVSAAAILNALEESGVAIGSWWPGFTNDLIQARVLLQIPELSVVALQVHGSRLEVIVRERIPKPAMVQDGAITEIVAEKAGIIDRMHVLRGDAAVKKGDTVLAGELLVAAQAHGRIAAPRPVHALAEVQARTWYELTAQSPLQYAEKRYTGEEKHRFALILGKTRINFYGNSGISLTNCDKIISEYRAAVKDVFLLPVTLVRETFREYAAETAEAELSAQAERMEQTLTEELRSRLADGARVVSTAFSVSRTGETLTVTLRAECLEDIAAPRPAETAAP